MPRTVAPVAPPTLAAGETPVSEVELLTDYTPPKDAATTATHNTITAMIDKAAKGARVRVLSEEVQTMVNRWQRVASGLGHKASWHVESQDEQAATEEGKEPVKFTTGVFTLAKREASKPTTANPTVTDAPASATVKK